MLRDPIELVLGLRLRVRRQTLGISQADLAEALAVTVQQLERYELAQERMAAVTLIKAAQRLNSTVAALVGEEVTALAYATPPRPMRQARVDETTLLDNYRAMSPELQAALLDLSRLILEKGVALDGVLQRPRRPGGPGDDPDEG
jgi:transcriptional regulator with XRE-family HTH domain